MLSSESSLKYSKEIFYIIQLINNIKEKVNFYIIYLHLCIYKFILFDKPENVTQIRCLYLTSCMEKVLSFKLSDIGEGIREVTVKEW